MDPEETQHLLPDGSSVWVQSTATASTHLPNILAMFRTGATEPLIFGDAGQPEAVVIPFEVWRALVETTTDTEGFDASYSVARHRLKSSGRSVLLDDDLAAELGVNLSEPIPPDDLPPVQSETEDHR